MLYNNIVMKIGIISDTHTHRKELPNDAHTGKYENYNKETLVLNPGSGISFSPLSDPIKGKKSL